MRPPLPPVAQSRCDARKANVRQNVKQVNIPASL
jgi:hypothetical protein